MKKYTTYIISLIIILLFCSCDKEVITVYEGIDEQKLKQALAEREANDLRTGWFNEAKYGVMIHWGPSSVAGVEIGWGRECYPPDFNKPEWTFVPTIPQEEYDSLYKQFNPVNFNADEWVRAFKEAGFKYLVFVTKHHDGFSMFDNPYTQYKICSDSSPVKYDIAKQISDACHKYGLRLGFYYSLLDWFHPAYYSRNHSEYINFATNQVKWLLSNYGQVDIVWFDCGQPYQYFDGNELYFQMIQIQPNIMINNRLGRYKMDFYAVEGYDGEFDNNSIWERCENVVEQYWSYNFEQNVLSFDKLMTSLFTNCGNGGNFLLNVSPKPNGELDAEQMKSVNEIGKWLDKYGECIYGTRGGPYYNYNNDWGWATYKDSCVYLIISKKLNPNGSLTIPKLSGNIIKKELITKGTLDLTEIDSQYSIKYSGTGSDKYIVAKLTFDKSANTFNPINGGY